MMEALRHTTCHKMQLYRMQLGNKSSENFQLFPANEAKFDHKTEYDTVQFTYAIQSMQDCRRRRRSQSRYWEHGDDNNK